MLLRPLGDKSVRLRQFTFIKGLNFDQFRKHCFTLYPPLFPYNTIEPN